jgi:sensor histidine kinase YesM
MISKTNFIQQENDSAILLFIMNKKWSWLRHFILILIIGLNFSLLNIDGLKQFAQHVNVPFKVILIGNAAMAFLALIIIYINLYIIFPVFFKQGKYLYYAICIIALVVFFFLVIYTIQQINVKHYGKDAKDAISLSVFGFIETVMYPLVFLASTTGYRLFKIWIVDQKKFAALEKSQLNTELTQLKNQVNPHFLFNTLNNLEVLTKTNPEKASQIILGLSDVLRYQIYDSQNETVLLSKDIEIIQQYIELEKIRRDHLTTTIKIQGEVTKILIPPLLFTNFIDNAIKHSNSRGNSFIHISFIVENNEVFFTITRRNK